MIYLPKFFYNGVLFSFDNVIVAGGREPNLQWFKQLVDSKEVHCADHGMDLCYKANIIPKTIVGDMDSCDPLALNFFQKLNVNICKYDKNKNSTDFKLLLDEVVSKTVGSIVCTGIWGGRFDHLYSIINYIRFVDNNRIIIMLDDQEMLIFMKNINDEIIIVNQGNIDNISLLPWEESVQVSIENVKWPLDRQIISNKNVYSISNTALQDGDIKVNLYSGSMAIYVNFSC